MKLYAILRRSGFPYRPRSSRRRPTVDQGRRRGDVRRGALDPQLRAGRERRLGGDHLHLRGNGPRGDPQAREPRRPAGRRDRRGRRHGRRASRPGGRACGLALATLAPHRSPRDRERCDQPARGQQPGRRHDRPGHPERDHRPGARQPRRGRLQGLGLMRYPLRPLPAVRRPHRLVELDRLRRLVYRPRRAGLRRRRRRRRAGARGSRRPPTPSISRPAALSPAAASRSSSRPTAAPASARRSTRRPAVR